MTRWRTRHRGYPGDRGAAAVEFAIVLVVLLLIIFAIIDFGRLLFAWQSMKAASREGARVGVVGTNTGAAIWNKAQESGSTAASLAGGVLVVTAQAQGDTAPTTLSSTTSRDFCTTAGNSLTVNASTDFRWFTPTMPLLGLIVGPANVPRVDASTTMRCE